MADIPAWEAFARKVQSLKAENKEMWMASNRQSEWLYAESKYDDLYGSVQSVIRYCKYGTKMTAEKHL